MPGISVIWLLTAAMAAVVVASNFLVQFPFNYMGLGEILTWGAFTYPIAFLVNDLANRRFGPKLARNVVFIGFILAVMLSAWLASPRIALASGSAFLVAQLLDISIFDRLREGQWWRAPLISTFIGSAIDTVLFFSIAFASAFSLLDTALGREDGSLAFPVPLFGMGMEVPLWASLALGDLVVKLLVGVVMLVPYGAAIAVLQPARMGSTLRACAARRDLLDRMR